MGTQAALYQPRHSIKKLAMLKAGRPDTPAGGGHAGAADRISNPFASMPQLPSEGCSCEEGGGRGGEGEKDEGGRNDDR